MLGSALGDPEVVVVVVLHLRSRYRTTVFLDVMGAGGTEGLNPGEDPQLGDCCWRRRCAFQLLDEPPDFNLHDSVSGNLNPDVVRRPVCKDDNVWPPEALDRRAVLA